MNEDALQIRRLMRWNRFWLVLLMLCSLVMGFNFLEQRIITYVCRLQVAWDGDELVVSSSGGGPFIVTQLATDEGGQYGIDTAIAAIAQLPRPLFVRGPKARTSITASELSRLTWVNSEGKKVAPPKPQAPVLVLYYETQKMMATPAK